MALELGDLSVEELAKAIPCNEKIALENKLRYHDFFNEKAYLPALLAYYGQAYKCLKAQEYSQEDFSYADKHLWITSFLYGLLRPLDLIHPYRLEGWQQKSSNIYSIGNDYKKRYVLFNHSLWLIKGVD